MRHPRALRVAVVVVLLGLFVGMRLLFLRADPPLLLSTGNIANELFVEPVAKAHEARNLALFGAWQTNPADNYQFWRVQSPMWVYPLAWWFQTFGVSYVALRAFAVLTASFGFALFMALAARGLRGVAFVSACALLGFDVCFFQFTRVGVIEPLVIAFITAAVYALLRARENLLWLCAAEIAFVLAVLTKQTAFYMLPFALGFGVHALVKGRASGSRRLSQGLVVGLGLGLSLALAKYVARPEYLRTVFWNYGHMIIGADPGGDANAALHAHGMPSVGRILERAFDASRYADWFFITMPVTSGIAVAGIIGIGWRAVVRREVDRFSLVIALWLASGWAALLLTDEPDVRFRLILFPPVALLAGSGIQWVATFDVVRRETWLRYGIAAWLLGAFVRFHVASYIAWIIDRSYVIPEVNASVTRVVGPKPAVIVGLWAPPLVFETPYVFYYVKNDFNATKEALTALGVTHGLIRSGPDWTRTILKRTFPDEFGKAPTLMTYFVRTTVMTLCDFGGPLGAPPSPRSRVEPPRALGSSVRASPAIPRP